MSESDTQQAKVRRFEPGASGQGNDLFLQTRGYFVRSGGGVLQVRGPHDTKPKTLTRSQLMELLDSLRIAEGKEPIVKR